MTYSPFRHLPSIVRKTAPIQLTFFVTRRCNARCPFCFYLRTAAGPPSSGEELTLEEIDRISRSLGDLLWLAFSGGEIFLRDDLAEIARDLLPAQPARDHAVPDGTACCPRSSAKEPRRSSRAARRASLP